MPKFKVAIATILILLLAFSSCQKQATEQPISKSPVISVEEAKNWLSAGPSGLQTVFSQHRDPGTPNWEDATVIAFSDKSSILKVPLAGYKLPVGYRDLLFQKDSNGVVLGAIQEIRPENNYLEAKGCTGSESMRQFVSNEDFSGDIIIFDPFNNAPLRGRRFKDGLLTGELKYRSQALMVDDPIDPLHPKKKPGGLDDGGDDDGPGFEITLPTVEITAPTPGTPTTPGTNIPFPTEPVMPAPGGPVTPNNPIPIGGGGTVSNTNSVKTITNLVKDPCISAEVQNITSGGWANEIVTKLNNIFNFNDKVNITFKDMDQYLIDGPKRKPLDLKITMGTTIPATQGPDRLDVTVYLNKALGSTSKEFSSAIIVHEIIHGILSFHNINSTGTMDHNDMLGKYYKSTVAMMQSMFPTLGTYDAQALIWIGASDTVYWSTLASTFPSNLNDLINLALKYKSGEKGTKCSN